jgi:hypothetical protein
MLAEQQTHELDEAFAEACTRLSDAVAPEYRVLVDVFLQALDHAHGAYDTYFDAPLYVPTLPRTKQEGKPNPDPRFKSSNPLTADDLNDVTWFGPLGSGKLEDEP